MFDRRRSLVSNSSESRSSQGSNFLPPLTI
jgi:hypothetical protein